MKNKSFHFVKNLRISLIVYAAIICIALVVGIVFGVDLDITFKGGSRFTYTYSGEINIQEAEKLVEDTIGKDVVLTQSSAMSGAATQKLYISLVNDESLEGEIQQKITDTLTTKYKDNSVKLGDSKTVSPTIAGSFFKKALFAVALAAALVVIYVGIRFKKIGGVSAAMTAFAALILDILVAFAACVIFRLQIDSNFMAVVLTILGYSLNDTIVIYDRIRENKRVLSGGNLEEVVDTSITQVMRRTIITTVTTFMAILTVFVVSEICGLTTLRTFTIPMAFGIISGSVSSMCVSGPLWVRWCNWKQKHDDAKAMSKKKSNKKSTGKKKSKKR